MRSPSNGVKTTGERNTGSSSAISTRPRAPVVSRAVATTALVVVDPQSNPTSLIA